MVAETRDLRIVRLYRARTPKEEISRHVGVSPTVVSKVIGRYRASMGVVYTVGHEDEIIAWGWSRPAVVTEARRQLNAVFEGDEHFSVEEVDDMVQMRKLEEIATI